MHIPKVIQTVLKSINTWGCNDLFWEAVPHFDYSVAEKFLLSSRWLVLARYSFRLCPLVVVVALGRTGDTSSSYIPWIIL